MGQNKICAFSHIHIYIDVTSWLINAQGDDNVLIACMVISFEVL